MMRGGETAAARDGLHSETDAIMIRAKSEDDAIHQLGGDQIKACVSGSQSHCGVIDGTLDILSSR